MRETEAAAVHWEELRRSPVKLCEDENFVKSCSQNAWNGDSDQGTAIIVSESQYGVLVSTIESGSVRVNTWRPWWKDDDA